MIETWRGDYLRHIENYKKSLTNAGAAGVKVVCYNFMPDLLAQEARRKAAGEINHQIPMRPDHGHLLVDEASVPGVKPGYSYLGRMKGLAELRGVIHALTQVRNHQA